VTGLRLHGDRLAVPGLLDFAVNVWHAPRPAGLRAALAAALDGQGYPDPAAATAAVAARHARAPEEVLPLNGACEAFWLLAHALRPRLAACVHPDFTEPEVALRAAGAEVVRVPRAREDWALRPAAVPKDADLVVLGNPGNPTGRLEPADAIASLARPGRALVVDESFIDFVPGEAETLAGRADVSGLVVVRSLTKLWALPGVRAGYLLAPPELVRRLAAHRQPWSVNAPALAALAWCAADRATPARVAAEVARARSDLEARLDTVPGLRRWPSAANFLLLERPGGDCGLRACGVAVRPARSFPGLTPRHLRVAVRRPPEHAALVAALSPEP
jgi:histidinol-phosphate/aromatic aminotransferase/cobyric acid decarboxylase-like protein